MSRTFPLVALAIMVSLISACEERTPLRSGEAQIKAAQSATNSAAAPASDMPSEEVAPNTLVVVNGEEISKEMFALYFKERLQKIPGAKNTPEDQMAALNELINFTLISQDATKKALHEQPPIAAAIRLMRTQLLTQASIQDHISGKTPSDDDLKKAYEEQIAGKPVKEYRARHILVDSEAKASEIIQELDKGADFSALAKEHSTGPTGESGGDLGWFDTTQMVKPFSDAVQTMTTGEYSKKPTKTQFGWHVILLEETREAPAPSFEDSRGKLATTMRNNALESYISGLRQSAQLKFVNAGQEAPSGSAAKPAPSQQ